MVPHVKKYRSSAKYKAKRSAYMALWRKKPENQAKWSAYMRQYKLNKAKKLDVSGNPSSESQVMSLPGPEIDTGLTVRLDV